MFSNVDKQMKSWVNPFSLGSIINMAGTEMHTNYAMLRQFSWASNSLWPIDLADIPSYVILSENDDIVPVQEVVKIFDEQANGRQTHVFKGACHGDMFLNDEMRSVTVQKIMESMQG
jgi:alpha/beta superfamily hydrolase